MNTRVNESNQPTPRFFSVERLVVLANSIKCYVGKHNYKHQWMCAKNGQAGGYRCIRCGRWHKTAIKIAT